MTVATDARRADGTDETRAPARATPAEEALVRAAQAGNSDALDALVRAHLSRAFSVAYRIMRNKDDAEDLVQDAFARAISRLHQVDPARPFGAWLHRIVTTQGFNRRESLARRDAAPLHDGYADNAGGPDAFAIGSDLRAHIVRAMQRLPERTRLVVELVEIEGFTPTEIAGMLDIAPGTARWHLHEGRRALRALLAHVRDDASRGDGR